MRNSKEKDDLLQEAACMIRDLVAGWPVKELHRNPQDLLAEIAAVLKDSKS